MSDFDGSWKDALDGLLRPFLAFFYPDIAAGIDWTVDPASLEQEFRALSPQGEAGMVRCDKLVRVALLAEQEPAYLHAEVQCQQVAEFPRRVFDYNLRATDHYGATVTSLVILGDDSPTWRPAEFHRSRWGGRTGVDFLSRKLLDYASRDEELEQHDNVIALVVLAHLKAIETRGDVPARRHWRLRLVRRIYQRELDHDDRQLLLSIVERLLDLSPDVEAEVRREIIQEQEGTNMPYVTSFERLAKEEGRTEGREEGLERGLRTGLLMALMERFRELDADFRALLAAAHLPVLERLSEAFQTGSDLEALRGLLKKAGERNGTTPTT
jgi:hypothetical protein